MISSQFPSCVASSPKRRADGADARRRLLHAALMLFAKKGFAKTSTREIALASGANLAAISYYFGDKAGLYRAAFTEPMGCAQDYLTPLDAPDLSLRQSLNGFMSSFLAPMKQGELVQQCTRLHFREMLEPTGVWAEEIDNGIKPAHSALVALLCSHLGLEQADDGLHRLAFSITGLAVQLFVTRDIVQAIRPRLLDPDGIDAWCEQMVNYAEAMVNIEAAQRSTALATGHTSLPTPSSLSNANQAAA